MDPLRPLLQFRNGDLMVAEITRADAYKAQQKVAFKTILECKHQHIGNVSRDGLNGRICLQCGLYEQAYAGYLFLKNELLYHIDVDVWPLVTARILPDDFGPLARGDITLSDWLKKKLSLQD